MCISFWIIFEYIHTLCGDIQTRDVRVLYAKQYERAGAQKRDHFHYTVYISPIMYTTHIDIRTYVRTYV